jgi:hypothetical protein
MGKLDDAKRILDEYLTVGRRELGPASPELRRVIAMLGSNHWMQLIHPEQQHAPYLSESASKQ